MSPRSSLLAVFLLTSPLDPAAAGQEQGAIPEEEALSFDDLDALIEEEEDESTAAFTAREIADIAGLALVLGFAMLSFFTKREALKVVALILSVAYLGFYKASLVTIVNVYTLLQGHLPELRYSIPWYLLIGFTAVTTVVFGRLYCGRICAFGALTQLLDRVVPAKLRFEPPPWLDRRAQNLKYVVLAAVLAYFIASGDVLAYRYVEPFWMFTLNGNAVMWTLLAMLLVATIFVRNLYCRYLCSVGATLGLISKLTTLLPIKRWQECTSCRICEKACEWGAIRGPEIVKSECVRCDDCERLYADEQKCVHWILARKHARNVAG